jgi:hypothetical protein
MSQDLAVPPWDAHGVLPPIRPGAPGHSGERAPYPVDALTLCRRFGATPERRAILTGFLDLRLALRDAGYTSGYQWINGSFTEQVEVTRGRPPRDIDVVTFAPLGDETAQVRAAEEYPELFVMSKERFRVDHFVVPTDQPLDADLARYIAYWYSMWAHRRGDQRWKGFVALALDADDAPARAWLEREAVAAPAEETDDDQP